MDAKAPASRDIVLARRAISLVFLANGAGFSVWAVALPAIKQRLALTEGEIGVVLLALAAGALAGMLLVAYRPSCFIARRMIVVAGVVFASCVAILPNAPEMITLVLGAALMGFAQALVDVAANVRATAINRVAPAPVLSAIHALFYVGVLAGSLAMAAWPTSADLAPSTVLAVPVALAMVPVGLAPNLPVGIPEPRRAFRRPTRSVLRVGVLILVAFLLEGAMLDWGAIYLASLDPGRHLPAWGFVVFALGMVAGRLAGDRVSMALGAARTVRTSAVVAGAGLLLAVLAPVPVVILLAFAIVGLGLSNMVPQLFALAARVPDMPPATSIAIVSILGYSGALGGPPAIGFAADHLGLRVALGAVALLALGLAALKKMPEPDP